MRKMHLEGKGKGKVALGQEVRGRGSVRSDPRVCLWECTPQYELSLRTDRFVGFSARGLPDQDMSLGGK